MRELTLLETSYLAGLLLLSLVLPLLMTTFWNGKSPQRRTCLQIVWLGQACGAAAAFTVLVSAALAPYATALGGASYLGWAWLLGRRLRSGVST